MDREKAERRLKHYQQLRLPETMLRPINMKLLVEWKLIGFYDTG